MNKHEIKSNLVIESLIYQNTELKQKLAENENRIAFLEEVIRECRRRLDISDIYRKNQLLVIHNQELSTEEKKALNF